MRNGVRQPVTLNMTVTAEELASLTAESGTITYSVDELEVKTIDFRSVPAPEPVVDTAPVAEPVAAAKVAKPIVQPARKTASATQA
jgi:hypothetical protein